MTQEQQSAIATCVCTSASLAPVSVNQSNQAAKTPPNSANNHPTINMFLSFIKKVSRQCQKHPTCTNMHRQLIALPYMLCRSEDYTGRCRWAACLWWTPDQFPPASPVPPAEWGRAADSSQRWPVGQGGLQGSRERSQKAPRPGGHNTSLLCSSPGEFCCLYLGSTTRHTSQFRTHSLFSDSTS